MDLSISYSLTTIVNYLRYSCDLCLYLLNRTTTIIILIKRNSRQNEMS